MRIDNSNSVLTFDSIDLYAEEEADLEEVWLFANPALAGTILTAQWNARSRDAAGVMRDTLEIAVDTAVPPIDDLLAETEQPPDDEEPLLEPLWVLFLASHASLGRLVRTWPRPVRRFTRSPVCGTRTPRYLVASRLMDR